jgi:hypothetical protein
MSGSDQESYVQNRRGAAELDQRQVRIRELNDRLRKTFTGGRVMITAGVQELGREALQSILIAVQQHAQFDGDNDPYHEHDFGSFTCGNERGYWKIDYYDKSLEFGSPDPADPDVTARVITIMLAAEY